MARTELPGRGSTRGWNILLITLDTVRADRLGCYGRAAARTPNLDALAASGIRFADAVTVAPVTLPAHASILTGLYPPNHGVRRNAEYRLAPEHTSLAEVLQEHGYDTAAFVGSFVLDGRFGLAQGFDHYDDRVDVKARVHRGSASIGQSDDFEERDGGEVTDAARAWLAARRSRRPFFVWVHYFDPHRPWDAPPEFAKLFPDDGYDAEIAHTDSLLGRLLDALGGKGLRSRTLVVVTADHGEGLGDHGETGHDFFLYDSVVRVPLVLSAPGLIRRPGVIADRVVSLVDLFPTILDLVGIGRPGPIDGVSLAAPGFEPERAVYLESLGTYMDFGMAPLFALRGHGLKYVRAPRPELYDLDDDPAESRNLIAVRSEAAGGLRERLEALLSGWTPPERVALSAAPIDDDTREKLTALGYLGGSTRQRGLPGDGLTDPKDGALLYRQAETAVLENGRTPERALAELQRIVAAEPGNRVLLREMARLYVALDRLSEAEGVLRRLIQIRARPGSLTLLGQVLIAQGRFDEVDPLARQALAIDAKHGAGHALLGDLAVQRGDFPRAEECYARALAVDPYRMGNRIEERRAWMRRVREARPAAATEGVDQP